MEQSGFYASVNNNSQFPLTKFEGIKLATGFSTNVAIRKVNYQRLEAPYSDCRKDVSTFSHSDSEYFKSTVKTNKYSQKLCFQICIQMEYIVKKCNCADPSTPVTNQSVRSCLSWDDLSCVNNVTTELNNYDLKSICGQQCPLECDSQNFEYSISMANYPTVYYYNVVKKQPNLEGKFGRNGANITRAEFEQSVALVNFYLEDLVLVTSRSMR